MGVGDDEAKRAIIAGEGPACRVMHQGSQVPDVECSELPKRDLEGLPIGRAQRVGLELVRRSAHAHLQCPDTSILLRQCKAQ